MVITGFYALLLCAAVMAMVGLFYHERDMLHVFRPMSPSPYIMNNNTCIYRTNL